MGLTLDIDATRWAEPFDVDAALDAAAAARAATEAAWAAPDGPSDDDFATLDAHAGQLRSLLDQAREALGPLHVAGVAFVDPELPEELARLARRAGELGLGHGVELLTVLGVRLASLPHQRGRAARNAATLAAWEALQRLVAWVRLSSVEHDLLCVEGNLRAVATGRVQQADTHTHTETMDVWPLGAVVSERGDLTIYAMELDRGELVLMRDTLAPDVRDDPFAKPIISRLFQRTLALESALGQVAHFEDHPVAREAGRKLLAPAFNAVPLLRTTARARSLPRPQTIILSPRGAPTQASGPDYWEPMREHDVGTLRVAWTWHGGEALVPLTPGDQVAPLKTTPTLAFNALKHLLDQPDTRAPVLTRCAWREGALEVLSTGERDRAYPALDPRAVRVRAEPASRRLSAFADKSAFPLLRLLVQTHTPHDDAQRQARRAELLGLRLRGAEAGYLRLSREGSLRDDPDTHSDRVALVQHALEAAALDDIATLPDDAFEALMGRRRNARSLWSVLTLPEGHPLTAKRPADTGPLAPALLARALLLIAPQHPAAPLPPDLPALAERARHAFEARSTPTTAAALAARALLAVWALPFETLQDQQGELFFHIVETVMADDHNHDPPDPLDPDAPGLFGAWATLAANLADISEDGVLEGARMTLHELLLLVRASRACRGALTPEVEARFNPFPALDRVAVARRCAEALGTALLLPGKPTPQVFADAYAALALIEALALGALVWSEP